MRALAGGHPPTPWEDDDYENSSVGASHDGVAWEIAPDVRMPSTSSWGAWTPLHTQTKAVDYVSPTITHHDGPFNLSFVALTVEGAPGTTPLGGGVTRSCRRPFPRWTVGYAAGVRHDVRPHDWRAPIPATVREGHLDCAENLSTVPYRGGRAARRLVLGARHPWRPDRSRRDPCLPHPGAATSYLTARRGRCPTIWRAT